MAGGEDVAAVLQHLRFSTAPFACAYRPELMAQMNYRLLTHVTEPEYAGMLSRGWRRFGNQFFRPICTQCAGCRSLRVRVGDFHPSKSQRRNLRGHGEISVVVRPATVTSEHLELYERYHGFMAREKGWKHEPITLAEYRQHFLGTGFPFAHDFLYFLEGRLVAVGLVDVAGDAMSSAYFYHAPELRSRALGVFSLLTELAQARLHGVRHHYLGYWVPECASMAYKANYRPFELLTGFPADHEEPRWTPAEAWEPEPCRQSLGLVLPEE